MDQILSIGIILFGLLAAAWSIVYVLAYSVRGQLLGPTIWQGPRNANHVALTFDDGPGPETAELLDVLKQHDLKATFFLIGERAKMRPDIVRRIVVEGHEIGNHSLTHRIFLYCSRRRVFDEILQTQRIIGEIVGFEPQLARPPCGVRTPGYFRIARTAGLKTIQWDVAGLDWKHRSPDKIAEAVLSRVQPGSIILLHDGDSASKQDRGPTVRSIPLIAEGLRERGLKVGPLQNMLNQLQLNERTGDINSHEVISQ